MRSWFFVREGQKRGPVPEDELHEMLATGVLSPEALVWTAEMKQWRPAEEVDGLILRDFPPPPFPSPPPINDGSTAAPSIEGYRPSGAQARPWVRFWARLTDNFLFTFIGGFILGILYEPVLKIGDVLLGIGLLFVYIFAEAIMLSSWGTTPGKALLRIRLRRQDGRKLSFSEGLMRAFHVWILGEGLGFPVVALVTEIIAYRRLRRKGRTTWDDEGHFAYFHRTVGPLRTIATILVLLCFASIWIWEKLVNS